VDGIFPRRPFRQGAFSLADPVGLYPLGALWGSGRSLILISTEALHAAPHISLLSRGRLTPFAVPVPEYTVTGGSPSLLRRQLGARLLGLARHRTLVPGYTTRWSPAPLAYTLPGDWAHWVLLGMGFFGGSRL
jgi:hypothetical protein